MKLSFLQCEGCVSCVKSSSFSNMKKSLEQELVLNNG